MKTLQLQIVQLTRPPGRRPAAFVFLDPDGATWIEPSYRDPYPNTMPAAHRVAGSVAQADGVVTVTDDAGVRATFSPWTTPGADDPGGTCKRALADFTDLLVLDGVTLDEEQAAIAPAVTDNNTPDPIP